MNRPAYERFIDELSAQDDELLKRKSKDYNDDNDVFSNFRMASFIGMDPRHAILWEMMKKIGRIGNLLSRENTNFESVEDNCADIRNYSVILRGIIGEMKKPH